MEPTCEEVGMVSRGRGDRPAKDAVTAVLGLAPKCRSIATKPRRPTYATGSRSILHSATDTDLFPTAGTNNNGKL